MAKNITGLGRGLDALIDTETINTNGSSSISEVEMNLIFANPNQPRSHFNEDALTELATSIRELGVISPITLRKNDDGTYLIIAGERRFRASKLVGLTTIPAYVRTAADEQVVEMALIENILLPITYACSGCLLKSRWALRIRKLTWVMPVRY